MSDTRNTRPSSGLTFTEESVGTVKVAPTAVYLKDGDSIKVRLYWAGGSWTQAYANNLHVDASMLKVSDVRGVGTETLTFTLTSSYTYDKDGVIDIDWTHPNP